MGRCGRSTVLRGVRAWEIKGLEVSGLSPTVWVGRVPAMHVEIFKGKGVQSWRFRLVGSNGEPVTSSEGYLTKWNAKRAARRAFGPTIEILFAKS